MIVHAIPGRLRLRHAQALTEPALESLAERIRAVAPSAVVEHTPATRGTLVRYEEKDRAPELMALLAEPADLAGVMPTSQRRSCGPSSRKGALRWPAMRQIKQGMALSLGASLGLAAMRRERGHAVAGGVFLGLLARHLWVYRRRLWK